MTGPHDHSRFEELAVGHALSALEPEDEHVFQQHLASCDACQRDVQEHRETLSILALSADPVDPPPSVLQGIRAGMAGGARDDAPRTAPADAPPPGVSSLDRARARRAGRPSRAAQWVGAAAAAALALSLGGWNLVLRDDRDAAQQYGDRLAAAVRDLSQPDSTSVPLAAEDGSVVAVAVVKDGGVRLVVDGLQPNGSGTSYVLWAQDPSGEVRPVGAFDVEQSQVDVVDDLPVEGVGTVTAYLVSQEQGDEAPPTPGGPVVASGRA